VQNKVSFVINDYAFFRSHRLSLSRALSKHFDVQIITDLTKVDEEELAKISSNKLKFFHLTKRKKSLNPVKFLNFIFKLKSILINQQSNYIFFVSLENCFIGSIISKSIISKNNFFLITGLQNTLHPYSFKGFIRKKIYKAAFGTLNNENNTFIFQNNFDQADFLKWYSKIKHELIEGNGVDLDKFHYVKRFEKSSYKNIKFLFASKLLKDKGFHEFIDASIDIKKKYSNCSFHIAGELDLSNEQSITKDMFEMMIKNPEINYHGHIQHSDMNIFLKKFDVLVLPSYREGLPSVAIEAAATGMPLIVTDVPGCNSLVIDDKNGYLVKSHSSQSIKSAIQRILKNPKKLKEFGKNSNLMIRTKFSIDKISKKYIDLINQC